ncbi:MAG: hypothetical protein ABIT83_06315 [Massilia sp.]
MDESLYAPPQADLSGRPEVVIAPPFYVVSLVKLTVLFIVTLGVYQLFWFYKNWSNYKLHCQISGNGNGKIWPVPRALFSVFFVHSLFRKVAEHAEANLRPLTWQAGSQATLMVVLLLVSAFAGRFSEVGIGAPFSDILTLLVMVALYFSMRSAQKQINASCDDPEGASNSEFTGANYFWIILGALFLLALFAAGFMGAQSAGGIASAGGALVPSGAGGHEKPARRSPGVSNNAGNPISRLILN